MCKTRNENINNQHRCKVLTSTTDALSQSQLDKTAQKLRIHRPHVYKTRDEGINNQNQLSEWVEQQATMHDKYGKYPEGFVLYLGEDGVIADC